MCNVLHYFICRAFLLYSYSIMPKNYSPMSQRQTSKKEITLSDVWCTLMNIQKGVPSHDNKLKSIVANIKSLETSF